MVCVPFFCSVVALFAQQAGTAFPPDVDVAEEDGETVAIDERAGRLYCVGGVNFVPRRVKALL